MSIASHIPRFVVPMPVEQRPLGRRARRIGVVVFFGSVAVNAALGIYAVLAPDFGDTQGKILATSLCVTGAVLFALACEPAWERRLLGLVPPASAALGVIGFGLTVGSIWAEPSGELWGKLVVTIFTASMAGVAASLIALARVSPHHGWLVKVTFALLGLAAVLYGVLPWLGDDPNEWYVRSLGVILIALAAFAVSVPVVHWLDRGALAAAEATDAVRFCPFCGRSVTGDPGEDVTCERCGRGFTVAVAGETKANLT
jgi:hypothetical protein